MADHYNPHNLPTHNTLYINTPIVISGDVAKYHQVFDLYAGVNVCPATIIQQLGLVYQSDPLQPAWQTPSGSIILYGGHDLGVLHADQDYVLLPFGYTVDSEGNLKKITVPGILPQEYLAWYNTIYFHAASCGKTPYCQRIWICGFEEYYLGDGSSGGISSYYSRDASRTIDGKGLAYRSLISDNITYNDPTPRSNVWERFYVRVRKPSTNEDQIWFCGGNVEGGTTLVLTINSGNQLNLYNKGNTTYPGTLIGSSSPIGVGQWAKIDICYGYKYAYGNGIAFLFVNGQPFNVLPIVVASGLGVAQLHNKSGIGNESVSSHGLEVDIDDWIGCAFPIFGGVVLFDGDDFVNGSHVQLISPAGFGNNHNIVAGGGFANWTGDYRYLASNPINAAEVPFGAMSGNTGHGRIDLTTDFMDTQIGCAAFTSSVYVYSSASVTSTLGINSGESMGSTGYDLLNPVTVFSNQWSTSFTSITNGSLSTLLPIAPLDLVYVKDAGAGSQTIKAFQGLAEFIGTWGPEDNPLPLYPVRNGIHNAPYPRSMWATMLPPPAVPPLAPVMLMQGSYVGNGVGQDIFMDNPPHWIWLSPAPGGDTSAGIHWWSSMVGAHGMMDQGPVTNRMPIVKQTTDGRWQVSLGGNAIQSNSLGVTYQWVAFSDPGARFCLNGAYKHLATTASAINPLADPTFLPLSAFIFPETDTAVGNGHLYKGPGHTSDHASLLNNPETTGIATLGTGSITTKVAINAAAPQTAYSAWRLVDGNGVTGPLAITSYTGDGTGSRIVPLLLQGQAPTFSLIVPHNGTSYYRDPSHTGLNSSDCLSNISTTAITNVSAANQITVGTTLNTNAIIYDVFVLTPLQVPTFPTAPPVPTDTRGWWASVAGFNGPATLITTPSNPKHGRCWDKLLPFATAGSGMLGGSPGAAVTIRNHIIYAGDDYTIGSTPPTIHTYGPLSDRLLTTLPSPNPAGGTLPIAVMSMLAVGDLIYISTFDSGTTSSNYAGRVFSFDPLSLQMQLIGLSTTFAGGEVPYALAWHMNRLWCGTNKSDGTAGKVYFFRPGIDTAWTMDHNMSINSCGGVCSLRSFQGNLYVGSDNASGSYAKILVRNPLGVYSVVETGTGGVAQVNNGYLSLLDFKTNLYATYWNPDGTAISKIRVMNGRNNVWYDSYYPTELTPLIALFIAQGTLYAIGGGDLLSASLAQTTDGTNWSDSTLFLTGPTTDTALPLYGMVGP